MTTINEQISDSFYVTLTSNKSEPAFHLNKPSSFYCTLLKTFDWANYKVGLSEIHYSDAFIPKSNPSLLSDDIVEDIDQRKDPWFDTYKNNHILIARVKRYVSFTFQKGEFDFAIFMNNFIRRAETNISFVKWFYYYNGETDMGKVTFKFENPVIDENYFFEINPTFAEILGFEQTVFTPGTHTAPNYRNKVAFNKLDVDTIMEVRAYRKVEYKIAVEEPDSEDNDLSAVLEKCSEALETLALQARFPIRPDNKIVFVELDTPDMSIQLPSPVNNALGLSDDFEIENNTTIVLPEKKSPKQRPANIVIITCDACLESQFGDSSLPILRIIDRKSGLSTTNHIVFAPVQYQSLKKTDVQAIHFQLLDSNLNQLPNTQMATCLVLNFKKII